MVVICIQFDVLGSVDHYNNLVAQYRESQSLQKGAYSKSKKASVAKPSTPFFSVSQLSFH